MLAARRLLPFAHLLLPALLAGCRIDSHKNGDNKDVSIGTPFGSLNVKTDESHAVAQTGLTPYPGASPVHKHDDDSGAADVNLSFGNFKLGVHAVELQTPDPQDKVAAFYRKDMTRYGTVITCRGHEAVGQPTRTVDGLGCDDHQAIQSHHLGDDTLELRAGSPLRQHIVGLREQDGGTHIGLVALDLPTDFKDQKDGDRSARDDRE